MNSETETTKAQYKAFEFRGSSKGFFKIWIVNIALSVLTLGIYSAWAKVRTNRYIYGNTFINGSNFEFNANAKRILYGRLIVFAFYGLFLFATDVIYNTTLALGVAIVFLLLLPWLVRQAISFRLKSASYRNVYFKYGAKSRSFYALALMFIGAIVLMLLPGILEGIFKDSISSNLAGTLVFIFMLLFVVVIVPIFYKKLKALIVDNSYYGKSKFNFSATNKSTIILFLKLALVTTIITILLVFIASVVVAMLSSYLNTMNIGNQFKGITTATVIILLYVVPIAFYKGIIDAFLSNFIRNNTSINECKFKGELEAIDLGIISATNTLATIGSFGLAYPWARVRYLKYKASNTYFLCDNYDKFISDGKDSSSTIGEETMDFFDIDIGV
jgi:uncharacterized membrane protein YjgN (DUF898 family)